MTQPVRLCVVGAGAIAERHMQAFERLGGVVPQWIVSRRQEAAEDFARRWKFVHAGVSIEAAFADPLVDLVLITSPSSEHSGQAVLSDAGKQGCRRGNSCGDELAGGTASTPDRRVVGRRVWVCHTMRSHAALREIRERIRSGRFHVTQISGFFGIPRRRNQGMGNVGTRSWIDNLLWHHGCHQVDSALWALDMPAVSRVHALFGPNHPTFGMALDVGIQMVSAGGQLITQALSYNLEQQILRLQFIGNEDVLTYNNSRLSNEAGEELVPETPFTDLTVQNRELLQAWDSGDECEYDLAKVMPTMEVLGRAQRSADGAA